MPYNIHLVVVIAEAFKSHLYGMEFVLLTIHILSLCCITAVIFELVVCLRIEVLLKEVLDGAWIFLKVRSMILVGKAVDGSQNTRNSC